MNPSAQAVVSSEQSSSSRPAVSPRDWSELELRERILAGQDAAWTELVQRYRALIYRCITKVTGKYAPDLPLVELEEIYADVLMALIRDDARKIRMYDPTRGAKLSSWIGMIAVNTAHDFLRSVGRRPMLDRIDGTPECYAESERTPLDMLLEKERWDHFNGLLCEFSDKDRTFLQLFYGQGLDAGQVADEMAISVKTVYTKKHKIRRHLRDRIERVGEQCAISDLAA
ncbi:RNA polymerase sigma factor [Haliangium sp.]|uniref:RNA polymerase sigma factor n=1 Tax=Haliangium sp. TaxID=2663208 RepID=UPI003D0E0D78